jgi:uncharacterized membrane protein YqiK
LIFLFPAGREADGMEEAIERFLGKGLDAVAKTAKQALDGALRGVAATMTPEQANANRLELAKTSSEKAREDMLRLGIMLDFLQIEEVSDDRSAKREVANTIVPAKAKREALMLEAEGHAARILEDGKAKAEALELLRHQWQDGKAENLFLIHLMPELLDKVTRVVADNLRVDKLTILDGGNGEALPAYVKNLTNSAIVMMEQMKNATGIDVAKLAKGTEQVGTDLPKELD